jgi:hypothetical protein
MPDITQSFSWNTEQHGAVSALCYMVWGTPVIPETNSAPKNVAKFQLILLKRCKLVSIYYSQAMLCFFLVFLQQKNLNFLLKIVKWIFPSFKAITPFWTWFSPMGSGFLASNLTERDRTTLFLNRNREVFDFQTSRKSKHGFHVKNDTSEHKLEKFSKGILYVFKDSVKSIFLR